MYCTFCGSRNHTTTNCPKTWEGQGNRMNIRCAYCGSHKHNINACPKTHDGSAKRTWNKDSIENDYIKD